MLRIVKFALGIIIAVTMAVIIFIPSLISIYQDILPFTKKPVAKMSVIATAYYHPHKNQNKFLHGSYKKEVKVNGTGIVFSSGKIARIGDIAADCNILPFGTVIWIPTLNLVGQVTDIGHAIKGRRIDVFMGEGERALERAVGFGRKQTEIFILEWGA